MWLRMLILIHPRHCQLQTESLLSVIKELIRGTVSAVRFRVAVNSPDSEQKTVYKSVCYILSELFYQESSCPGKSSTFTAAVKSLSCTESYSNSVALSCLIPAGDCLLDIPESTMPLPRELPGIKYSLDQQCQQIFGEEFAHCPNTSDSDICSQLWCQEDGTTQCTTRNGSLPWADGTKCSENDSCLNGVCMPSLEVMQPAVRVLPLSCAHLASWLPCDLYWLCVKIYKHQTINIQRNDTMMQKYTKGLALKRIVITPRLIMIWIHLALCMFELTVNSDAMISHKNSKYIFF